MRTHTKIYIFICTFKQTEAKVVFKIEKEKRRKERETEYDTFAYTEPRDSDTYMDMCHCSEITRRRDRMEISFKHY